MSEHALRLHVESRGTGPTLVLAHGFGGSARNFRPQLRALADVATVVVYDARGHARSEAPAEPEAYDFERLIDDYERVAAEASDAPVIAGGLSLGAATALGFARRRPERLAGLLLASLPATEEPQRRWARSFAEAIEHDGLDAAGSIFVWGERARFDPAGAKLIRQGLLEHPPHALTQILRRALAVAPSMAELAAPLAERDVPALIIAGGEDHAARAPSEALHALLPQSELVIVPGAGHVVNLVAPEPFNARVRELVARVGR